MSDLPPKADIVQQSCNVRFVPKADSCTAQKQMRLGCRAVGDELEFGCLRHRQVCSQFGSNLLLNLIALEGLLGYDLM